MTGKRKLKKKLNGLRMEEGTGRHATGNASPKAVEKASKRTVSLTRGDVFKHQDSQELRERKEEEKIASVTRSVGRRSNLMP